MGHYLGYSEIAGRARVNALLDGKIVCLRACWRLSYAVLSCA